VHLVPGDYSSKADCIRLSRRGSEIEQQLLALTRPVKAPSRSARAKAPKAPPMTYVTVIATTAAGELIADSRRQL
jgi:hypothetical protein